MSNRHLSAFSTLVAAIALGVPAHAQSVVSTHAGTIHFFEGAVYLGDQPLESHLGKYSTMPQGSELRTEDGRAEVLLTPGVFLRMGDHSSIRLVSNDLADTQVALTSGAVMVESGEPNADTSVTLMYKTWRAHLLKKGVYRIDSDPPCLWVPEGKAEVSGGAAGSPVAVERGTHLPFAGVLVTERSGEEPFDKLSDWSKGRGQSIAADKAITSQIDEDPASKTLSADAFAYFPRLGVIPPSVGGLGGGSLYSSVYSSIIPSQPGFSSIYLPGYTSRPYLLIPLSGGIRTSLSSPLRRIGVTPGSTFPSLSPRVITPGGSHPLGRPAVVVPQPSVVRPAVPHVGALHGVHR
jgi:hypothetical protein